MLVLLKTRPGPHRLKDETFLSRSSWSLLGLQQHALSSSDHCRSRSRSRLQRSCHRRSESFCSERRRAFSMGRPRLQGAASSMFCPSLAGKRQKRFDPQSSTCFVISSHSLASSQEGDLRKTKVGKLLSQGFHHLSPTPTLLIPSLEIVSLGLASIPTHGADIDHTASEFDERATHRR